jgi:hypothetical protein
MEDSVLIKMDLSQISLEQLKKRARLRERQILDYPLNRYVQEAAESDLEAIRQEWNKRPKRSKSRPHLRVVFSQS